jgi:hypothetical protein
VSGRELVQLPRRVGKDVRARIVPLDQIAQEREAHAAIGAVDRDAAKVGRRSIPQP